MYWCPKEKQEMKIFRENLLELASSIVENRPHLKEEGWESTQQWVMRLENPQPLTSEQRRQTSRGSTPDKSPPQSKRAMTSNQKPAPSTLRPALPNPAKPQTPVSPPLPGLNLHLTAHPPSRTLPHLAFSGT